MNKILTFILLSTIYLLLTNFVFAEQWTVCPLENTATNCDFTSAEGIQEAVDSAENNDEILIKAGKYTSDQAGSVFENRTCLVNLKGKDLTLKGEGDLKGTMPAGTILFGQGHDQYGDQAPYNTRAGICTNGGTVTINHLRVKEFQGGGLFISDAALTMIDSVIDGNDSGGIWLKGSSSIFLLNNYFVSNMGIATAGNPSIKAVNNTFYMSKALLSPVNCNDEVPTNLEFINNIVWETEMTIGLEGIGPNFHCLEKVAQFKQRNIKNNILYKPDNIPCYQQEYCENEKGNLRQDPIINASAGDQRGWMHGGDLSPRAEENSPALTRGDPSISVIIGATGGVCNNPSSTDCANYINNNKPPSPLPPEEDPDNPIQPLPNQPRSPQSALPPQIINPDNLPFGFMQPLVPMQLFAKNISLPGTKTGKTWSSGYAGMDFTLYALISAAYIMTVHFAIGIRREFDIFLMLIYFLLGAFLGYWFHSYESGFVLGVILSLIFF